MRYILLSLLLIGCAPDLTQTNRHLQRIAEELENYNENFDTRVLRVINETQNYDTCHWYLWADTGVIPMVSIVPKGDCQKFYPEIHKDKQLRIIFDTHHQKP